MKKAFEVQNTRMIKVSYLGPTNFKGSRICIYEPARYNDDTTQRKYFSYDYSTGDVMEQAYEILRTNGFNVVARAFDKDNYIFLCDNWGDDFIQVKDIKR